MAVSERELEENEVKLDNILHKIIESSKQIQELRENINANMPYERNKKALDQIEMLAEIIEHLGQLADIIDEKDEEITRELETEVKDSLDDAIKKIITVRRTMQ
jgi:hypothetical protein